MSVDVHAHLIHVATYILGSSDMYIHVYMVIYVVAMGTLTCAHGEGGVHVAELVQETVRLKATAAQLRA